MQIEYHWCLCCTHQLHQQLRTGLKLQLFDFLLKIAGILLNKTYFMSLITSWRSWREIIHTPLPLGIIAVLLAIARTLEPRFESWNIVFTKFYHFCSYTAETHGCGTFYHAINCYSFTYMNSNKCNIYPVIKNINYRSYLPLFGIDWQRADNPQWEIPICQSENETTCPLISEFVSCTEDAL